ncbi:MAG TPA: glycosyltransferase family 9 protein [Candidatus Elarobacter sp.]|nr:glycosyltransferase family 9 protein [Dongiaceae bacterium]HZW52923.1 glycosyltransferase family 9 protein [Candidatus Elarobacter sp.]
MRILLSRTDRVGDLILSTPAIASVRRSFPDAHVTLACSRYNSVAVDRSPDVDEIATVPPGVKPSAFGARFRGVDLAVALAPRDADHRIVAATRAPRRVGYTYETRYLARLVLRTMLTDVVLSQADPSTAERRPGLMIAHEVDQVLAVAAAAGARTLVRDLVLPVTAEDRAAVAHLPERPVVVQLGQRWSEKGSTTASALQLFRDLRALGRPLLATYGEDARALGEDVERAQVADAVLGRLPFHVWAAVFERAACVVTIDTGATHVASAVRAPTVVLFEHKWFRLASQEWSPYRVPNAILRKPPDESESSLRASRAEIVAAVASLL